MKKWLWLLPLPLLALAVLWIAQSDWLWEKVRRDIVEQAEKATGGRVELTAFNFEWKTFTATVDHFVIHGLEPAGQAPLLAVERVVVQLGMDTSIRSLVAEKPTGHLIVQSDGSTNIPQPKLRNGQNFDAILNLKIPHFDLRNGTLQVDENIMPWNAKGENLTARATFDTVRNRYAGELAFQSLHAVWRGRNLEASLRAKASMERNRIAIETAHVEGEGIVADISDAIVSNGLTGKYRARYGKDDAEGTFRFASPHDYLISGNARGELRGVRGNGSFEATPGLIKVRDAHVTGYGGQGTVSAEIHDLKTFTAKGTVSDVPLRYGATVSGVFTGAGSLSGVTAGTFQGHVGGAGRGEVDVRYTGSRIEFAHSWIEVPHTRVDLSGTLGERLKVQLQSTDLTEIARTLKIEMPVSFSELNFDGTVSGELKAPRIEGHVSAKNLKYGDQQIDSVTGELSAANRSAALSHADVSLKGYRVLGEGTIALTEWLPSESSAFTAKVSTKKDNIAVSGTLNGTVSEPRGAADVIVSKGVIYGQPYDAITGHVQVLSKRSYTGTGLFVSGPKRVNMSGRFDAGLLEFNLTSNTMPLNEIHLIRLRQPDIHGFGKFHADGTARVTLGADKIEQFDLLSINADASANGLELGGRNLGDARLTAATTAGVATAHFESNAAQASIHGDGTVRLSGDYPLNARVVFANVGLNALAALILKSDDARSLNFDGSSEGEMVLAGSMKAPEKISATFDVTRLEMHALNLPGFAVTNNGPLRATMTGTTFRVERARLQAPQTDVTLAGSVFPLGLQMKGTVNLALVKTFNADLTAAGIVSVDAAVKGNWNTPDLSGSASLTGGSFHYADFSNGLTNAKGEVAFNGTRANIQSFTAESGGGRVDVSGFAALTGGSLTFRMETNASGVRVRYPEGVSSVSDARLTLAGTSQRSQASGTVTIHRVAINPKSDAATILASTAQPIRTPAVRTGVVENVNLDIQIETAPDVTLETSVTQTIQADANLRLRGTITNPALLGRINITQGELVFFGNRYSINQGAISFYNPSKIDPILNIDLETKARGVDVILTVTGPVDKLNLSYRSDPPLQFSDIVALLATGRTPGDPTQAVRDTGQSQSFQQLGTSAFLGQAIANPVAGRLQRFFGVSRLKIDPQLTGITGSPQARLTVEQQVTPDILFTYVTDVSSTSTQLIRVEWAYNRHWSAILTREENGYVGIDFAYKKRFK